MARQDRNARRRHHRVPAERAGRHARPPVARRRRAADVALALFPACRAAGRSRPRRPPEARRFPAACAAAAPHVGRRPPDVPCAAAHRTARDTRIDDREPRGQDGPQRPACLRDGAAPDRVRRRAVRRGGARHRLSRCAAAGRTRAEADRGAGRRRVVAHGHGRRGAAVPLFGADLQRPPHPLRPQLRDAGGRLSGARRARPADRDAARRSRAARTARCRARELCVPRGAPDVRRGAVHAVRQAVGRRQDDRAVGEGSRRLADDAGHRDRCVTGAVPFVRDAAGPVRGRPLVPAATARAGMRAGPGACRETAVSCEQAACRRAGRCGARPALPPSTHRIRSTYLGHLHCVYT
ncbi:hypothetical protein BCEP4_2470006 [Burkholderia cepacia]|nr:hypothetical protein BCEP4_2470006 [Burkholderia cepacia]